MKHQGHYDGLTSIPALMNRSYYCRHCDKGYSTEEPYLTTAKARIVPPVFFETRHALIMQHGLSLPFIALIVIACFMERTVLKPKKSKVKRERTRVFVNPGRNVYFAMVTTISIPKNVINVIMSAVPTVVNSNMWRIDATSSPL